MMRSPLLSELFSLRDTLDTLTSQSSRRGSNDAAVAMPMPIDVFLIEFIVHLQTTIAPPPV